MLLHAGKRGPVSKAEILQLYTRGTLGLTTPFWCSAMSSSQPQPLCTLRELRWLVSGRAGEHAFLTDLVLVVIGKLMYCVVVLL